MTKQLGQILLLILAGVAAPACGQQMGSQPTTVPAALAERRLKTAFEALGAEGLDGIALVDVGGKTVFIGASGIADSATGTPMRADTLIPISSITKSFTAAAILKLQDQGKLSVQDKVGALLPEVKGPLASATIHQLLTHTSGIPSFTAGVSADPDPEPVGREEFLRRVSSTPLQFEPGTGSLYSNAGYSILATIIENVSHQPYARYIADHVIGPVAKARIGYLDVDRTAEITNRNGIRLEDYGWGKGGPYWNLIGNGGFIADARDMAKWIRAFWRGHIVAPAAVTAAGTAWANQQELGGEGYGWIIAKSPTRGEVFVTAGGDHFSTAEVRYYPDIDMTTVVASSGARRASEISTKLVAAMNVEPEPKMVFASNPAEEALVQATKKALAGDAAAARAFIENTAGPVFVKREGMPKIAADFEAARRVLAAGQFKTMEMGAPGEANLLFDVGGKLESFRIRFGGTPEKPRIAGFTLDPK